MNLATIAQEAANDPNGTRDLIIGAVAVGLLLVAIWWLINKIF